MRIAILGATGMLGHHTALAAQAAGHEVIVLHRPNSDLARIEDIQGERRVATLDKRQWMERALEGVDAVINCAAYYPTTPKHWKDEVKAATYQMQKFYDACAIHPLKKIVYLGGSIALPKNPSGDPGHADLYYPQTPNNKNAYLQVKWTMDKQALAQANNGLPVVVGIPSMTFGEFDYGPSTGQLITEIANGTLPAYVRGQRNVIYAGDAGRGLLACAEKGQPGKRYLLTGENTDMDTLVSIISKLSNRPTPKAVPLGMAKAVNQIQTTVYKLGGKPPKVSETAIAVMSAGQHLDGKQTEKELNFKPEISTESAVNKAFQWFLEQGYIGE
ncbi:MAG: NAD-dependent epimerase/dehydratase family protein [Gammaproteobacteria bacterium]|nr:NAD-dependent epimerase/dehydratase family protein [Gammaproteobacteria bacterium]